jgi:biotin-dependent carboxylase-like uncharacterized protein
MATEPASARALDVLRPGPSATVQDLGRPGQAALGVPGSGALDRGALRLGNRLVANPEGASAVEATLGGLALRARGRLTLALAGAPAELTVDGRPVGPYRAVTVPDGATVVVGTPTRGMYCYLAVRGGLATPVVLGSRSTDVLSGIGAPLVEGDLLPVGPPPGEAVPAADVVPVGAPTAGDVEVRALLGPRHDWFDAQSLTALAAARWLVTGRTSRVGMRLAGPKLRRARAGELPSEGTALGALQVPPTGQPVLFLADHPVTGGYPVIAVVRSGDLDRVAQARPGQHLRLRIDA